MPEELEYAFPWLGEEEWEKSLWEYKSKVGSFLSVFNMYGMGDYIPHVLGQIVDATIDLTMIVRGEDRPIAPKQRPIER
jgi:hypothetical protein